MINIFNFCTITKTGKKLVMLLPILYFGCNGKQHNEENLRDTMVISQKVTPVKKNNKTSVQQNIADVVKNQIAGKTFTAELSHGCRMTTNGAYDIYHFILLTFNKDTVTISHQRIGPESRIMSKKIYSWSVSGNSVHINNFDDYGALLFKADTLKGTDTDGSIIKFVNKDVSQYLERKKKLKKTKTSSFSN